MAYKCYIYSEGLVQGPIKKPVSRKNELIKQKQKTNTN